MTSNEMQKMRDKGDDYYIIKINWLEKIIKMKVSMYMYLNHRILSFLNQKK